MGVVVLVLVALLFAVNAAVRLPAVQGQGTALVALGLLVGAGGAAARLVTDARPSPPPAGPGRWGDEPALVLARDRRPTQVSSWTLALLGVVLLLGAVVGAVAGEWVVVVLAGLAGAFCLWSGSPHRSDLAGGLWLTPTGVVHAYRGRRWILAWGDLTDVVDSPGGPRNMDRLLLLTGPGAMRDDQRYGPPGRAWRGGVRLDDRGPLGPGGAAGVGVLGLELEGLPLGALELADLLRRAAADPGFRAGLGTR